MFKVALIGAGFIAQNHIAALKKIPEVTIAAVITRNSETGGKVAQECGCKWYPDLAQARAEAGVNTVDICVPTGLHEFYVVEAARAGCHVFCEKPVTFTCDSFDRMVKACEDNNVRFMVGQVARWWPEFITIKEYIDQGKLGDIHMIYEKRLCQHPTWSTWHRDPAMSGGGLYDLNVHDIDYLYSIFGKPESVYANGWKSSTGCWNHVVTNLRWSCGAKACVETSLEMTGNWPFSIELRIVGDKGTLSYALTAGFNINDGEMGSNLLWYPVGEEKPVAIEAEQIDMFHAELVEFFDAIKKDRPTCVTFEENRGVLEVIEASLKSLEENIVVTL
ncbi:MAG: Gfo/Idh/MocA family protein [Candidatus Excrementavichristensenella sp.]|jgi:UDP-N-acetylglucosamine 3-dehydrogenase